VGLAFSLSNVILTVNACCCHWWWQFENIACFLWISHSLAKLSDPDHLCQP
jgi:hypothetical protein